MYTQLGIFNSILLAPQKHYSQAPAKISIKNLVDKDSTRPDVCQNIMKMKFCTWNTSFSLSLNEEPLHTQ